MSAAVPALFVHRAPISPAHVPAGSIRGSRDLRPRKGNALGLTSLPLLRGLVFVGLLALVAGCGNTPAKEAGLTRKSTLASADVAVAPKDLVAVVQRAVAAPPLSLAVEQQDRGTTLTGWKRYRGDWHIGRHWQERTRFRIDVSPDFDEPLAKSHLSVVAETEQRAAEGQRWDREPRVPRPGRAEDVLKHILAQVPSPPGNR